MSPVVKKSILLIIAVNDFNETEFLTVKTELARKNYNVFIASDSDGFCRGENGLKVKGDISFFNMKAANFGGVIVIGGKGIKGYRDNIMLHSLIKEFNRAKKAIGAICGAPVVLSRAGILAEKDAVCYYPDKAELEKSGAIYKDSDIVVSKNIITAKGPSTTSQFITGFINILEKL